MSRLDELEALSGETFFDHQREGFDVWMAQPGVQPRLCLYHRTGAGKSLTALVMMALRGVQEVLVIAPPATHPAWVSRGTQLGVEVTAISHAKFRQKGFLVSRNTAVIADEFHLFGGHTGAGWKKLDRLARALQRPMILASATPNYNDAERVYCIQHVLAPQSVKGGFLEFLYKYCETEQNPFGATPIVNGFLAFKDAEAYLAALPQVVYLPDNVVVNIIDIPVAGVLPPYFEEYGLDTRRGRIIASQMEERHRRGFYLLVGEDDLIYGDVMNELAQLSEPGAKPVLLFSNSSKIAEALHRSYAELGWGSGLVTGKTSAKQKEETLDEFRRDELDILIGTATLATGVDGLDKVCDKLIIVNDTDDNALRRQLIGRIMPRGADADASNKTVFRLVMSS